MRCLALSLNRGGQCPNSGAVRVPGAEPGTVVCRLHWQRGFILIAEDAIGDAQRERQRRVTEGE